MENPDIILQKRVIFAWSQIMRRIRRNEGKQLAWLPRNEDLNFTKTARQIRGCKL